MITKHQTLLYQYIIPVGSLILTLVLIFSINNSLLVLSTLLVMWFFLFKPLNKTEIIIFIIGTLSIIGQNYSVLKVGGFSFRHQDFLLMPYYEPFMWGFYYLNMKRFINETSEAPRLESKSFLGLFITIICFSFFAYDSDKLTIVNFLSTLILLVMFHDFYDLYYAGYALFIGFIIEIFGVTSGNWTYPDPDIWGIPYWFITMWLSVGILGRRFLIPFAEMLNKKIG